MTTTLEFFEGPMRNGKSLLANDRAFNALWSGAVVGINYELIENWSWIYASRKYAGYRTKEEILERAISMWERCYRYGSLSSLEAVCRKAKTDCVGKVKNRREGKGLIIMDEVSLYVNSRNWQDHMDFIQFLTKLGKLECQMIMVSHSHEDIDKQVQRKIELITSVRNLQKRKIAGVPVGFIYRKPKFRAISMIAGSGAGKGYKEDKWSFGIPYNTCDLYDTFFEFGMDDIYKVLEPQRIGEHPQILFEKMTRSARYEKFAKAKPASVWPQPLIYNQGVII